MFNVNDYRTRSPYGSPLGARYAGHQDHSRGVHHDRYSHSNEGTSTSRQHHAGQGVSHMLRAFGHHPARRAGAAKRPLQPHAKHRSRGQVSTGSSAGGPIRNTRDFASQLLSRLGVPQTKANLQSIVNWEGREGGHWQNSARYNPLNTTMGAPGARSRNKDGVKAYNSWDQGLDATVRTLHQPIYRDIVAALASGNGLHGNIRGLYTWSGHSYSSI